MEFNISKEEMLEGMHKMNSFGTRLTGSKGHNDFINWLKNEIADMNITIFSDLSLTVFQKNLFMLTA